MLPCIEHHTHGAKKEQKIGHLLLLGIRKNTRKHARHTWLSTLCTHTQTRSQTTIHVFVQTNSFVQLQTTPACCTKHILYTYSSYLVEIGGTEGGGGGYTSHKTFRRMRVPACWGHHPVPLTCCFFVSRSLARQKRNERNQTSTQAE